MNFDVFHSITTREGKRAPGLDPNPMSLLDAFKLVDENGQIWQSVLKDKKTYKTYLPSICFMGKINGKRMSVNATPTQWVMIDIDHVDAPQDAWATLKTVMGKEYMDSDLLIAHITASTHGLRLVVKAPAGITTVEEALKALNDMFHFDHYGDFDTQCKNLDRVSFLVPSSLILSYNPRLAEADSFPKGDIVAACNPNSKQEDSSAVAEPSDNVTEFTDEEKKKYENMDWRGFKVKDIIKKYVEVYGTPTTGEIHNYHNAMIKYFRHLCSNEKRCLLYLLPKFGHSDAELWSQIQSICRVNTLSSLPREFYFFLMDTGFYVSRKEADSRLKVYMLNEETDKELEIPYLPPVLKELLQIVPKDFVIPSINALMPIIGTLTSYIKFKYPYDGRYHTTTFFSVIYAPPSTGKGFINHFYDLLFEDIKMRDYIQSQRENIYLRLISRKADNKEAPERPVTSLRIIPAKNSEAEFLQKQMDNRGYHMFTYAQEMDTWAKGVHAAGGNKDDLVRVAWDNEEYGQAFKSANTVKGQVNLFWNVLITGTEQQVDSYFKNVENGLVTRCCFTAIENQEFALPPVWKEMTAQALKKIKWFTRKCDDMTYEKPCEYTKEDVDCVSDEDFDNEIDWHFKYRDRIEIDMSWLNPTIDKFSKEQRDIALRDLDNARDVFRRRAAVRGYRWAAACTQFYSKFNKRDQNNLAKFIWWWMHVDLEASLRKWGAAYNEVTQVGPKLTQPSIFLSLPEEFSKEDVYVACTKQGKKTPIKNIIYKWKENGFIEKRKDGLYTKKHKKDGTDKDK